MRNNFTFLFFIFLTQASFGQSLDSITNKIHHDLFSVSHRADSSKVYQSVTQYVHLPDSITPKSDSLKKLKLNLTTITQPVNSLDSLNKLKLVENVKNIDQKLVTGQAKITSKVVDGESKIKEKLSGLNGDNLTQLNISQNTPELPNIDASKYSIENVFDQKIDLPDNGVVASEIPAMTKLDGLNLNTDNLSTLGSSEFKDLGNKTEAFSSISNELKTKQADIQSIGTGDFNNFEQLSKDLESKVSSITAVKDFQGQLGEVYNYKSMVEKWNSDPEVAKEMLLNKAKEQATNYFAGHEQELQAAVSQMTQLKGKFKSAEGALDLMKKKEANHMKGKPLMERIIPGLTLQIQKAEMLGVDFNPGLTYRLTGRLEFGTGWNERIIYDNKANEFANQKRIYGLRSFFHFKLKEGFWLRSDIENMNIFIPDAVAQPDQGHRDWRWGCYAGFKKDFRYSRNLMGNLQMLYNVYSQDRKYPCGSKINVRIGFELRNISVNKMASN